MAGRGRLRHNSKDASSEVSGILNSLKTGTGFCERGECEFRPLDLSIKTSVKSTYFDSVWCFGKLNPTRLLILLCFFSSLFFLCRKFWFIKLRDAFFIAGHENSFCRKSPFGVPMQNGHSSSLWTLSQSIKLDLVKIYLAVNLERRK